MSADGDATIKEAEFSSFADAEGTLITFKFKLG